MRKILYKISALVLSIMCLCSLTLSTAFSSAYNSYYNDYTGYEALIYDEADLLDSYDESDLLEDMENITEYGNAALVTTNSYHGSSESYAESFLFDNFGRTSSTVLLIDMYHRYIYIYSFGDIYDTITKSYANVITDNIYTYATDGDYYECASKAFDQINTLLEGRRISQPMKYISNALLALVISAVFCYILIRVLTPSNKVKKDELLGSIYTKCEIHNPNPIFIRESRVYSPPSSDSGGSSGGGGGGGGGGHSF